MVFFQLNVTGLLFQSFRTASPSLWSKEPCAAAPSAHKQSQFYCVKQSQFYCVDNHEQPRRGVRLFASTKQPVYRLEPSPEERGPGERWNLS